MIGSVLSNDFPLILIFIGNVLGLLGLKSLDRRGDGIRTFTTERISKSRTISDEHYMGSAQRALFLSPSPFLEFYLLNWGRYGARTFTTKWIALSPTLAPISRRCNIVQSNWQLALLIIRPTRHLSSAIK
jgi:hypothetical protein